MADSGWTCFSENPVDLPDQRICFQSAKVVEFVSAVVVQNFCVTPAHDAQAAGGLHPEVSSLVVSSSSNVIICSAANSFSFNYGIKRFKAGIISGDYIFVSDQKTGNMKRSRNKIQLLGNLGKVRISKHFKMEASRQELQCRPIPVIKMKKVRRSHSDTGIR
jgi:hypothetical protein